MIKGMKSGESVPCQQWIYPHDANVRHSACSVSQIHAYHGHQPSALSHHCQGSDAAADSHSSSPVSQSLPHHLSRVCWLVPGTAQVRRPGWSSAPDSCGCCRTSSVAHTMPSHFHWSYASSAGTEVHQSHLDTHTFNKQTTTKTYMPLTL